MAAKTAPAQRTDAGRQGFLVQHLPNQTLPGRSALRDRTQGRHTGQPALGPPPSAILPFDFPGEQPGREHDAETLAQRSQIVVGDPASQLQQRRRKKGTPVQHGLHRLDRLQIGVAARPQGEADDSRPAEGDAHPHSSRCFRQTLGQPVGKGPAERQGDSDFEVARRWLHPACAYPGY